MRISKKTLDEHGACFSQVARFVKLFGRKGGTVTKARCLKAAQLMDFDWAAEHLLSYEAETMYHTVVDKARRKYHAARRRATQRVDDAFDKLYETDRAKWEAVRDAGVDERSTLDSEFNKVKALAFWKAATSKYQG